MIRFSFFILGLLFLGITIFYLYKSLTNKDIHTLRWEWISFALSFFITFFLFYCVYLFYRTPDKLLSTNIILYFIAAVFVLIIIRATYNMNNELKKEEITYRDLILKLEYESSQKNADIKNKIKELEDSRSAMINILEDINEQKEMIEKSEKETEELNKTLAKANKDLMSLDEKKDQFTSIAAHELKTPLASIHGFVQLLQKKEIYEDKEKREKYLSIIISDTNRLTKLVTDILDVSRIDLGTLRMFVDEADIRRIIKSIENEMSVLMKAKNLEFIVNISPECPEKIMTDKGRLSQVMINLLSNALHYTDTGKIILNVDKAGDNLLVSVKDTGIGIPKESQDRLFERFFQVDNWMTRKISGSGLGLAISKGIVENLGGKIWVESDIGKGSTFYFTVLLKSEIINNIKN